MLWSSPFSYPYIFLVLSSIFQRLLTAGSIFVHPNVVLDAWIDDQDTRFQIASAPEEHTFHCVDNFTLSCREDLARMKILHSELLCHVPYTVQLDLQQYITTQCMYRSECKLTFEHLPFPVNVNCNGTGSPMMYVKLVCLRPKPTTSRLARRSKTKTSNVRILSKETLSKQLSSISPLDHLASLANSFLILQGVTASCSEIHTTQPNVTLKDAQDLCVMSPECTMIVKRDAAQLCSNTKLQEVTRYWGSTVLVKGSAVLQGIPEDLKFYIFLNHQAICEKDQLIAQHDGVRSIQEAVERCAAVTNCDYFVTTFEAGLTANLGESGPLPNHLWLCRFPSQASPSVSTSDRITAVSLYGTVSGYSWDTVNRYGEPILIAMPTSVA